MLLVMTVACLVVAPTYWLGGAYFVQMLISLALAGSCAWFYGRGKLPAVFVLAGLGVLAGLVVAVVSPALFLHAAMVFAACIVAGMGQMRPRSFAFAMAGTGLAAYGLAYGNSISIIARVNAMRERYPIQSITHRLAFERGSKNRPSVDTETPNERLLTAEMLNDLSDQENRHRYWDARRVRALQQLHEATYVAFVESQGFGVARMGPLRPEHADLPARQIVRLPIGNVPLSESAMGENLARLHRLARYDFLTAERIGYVRSREEVAGFEAHGFSMLAEQLAQMNGNAAAVPIGAWELTRLELVSLLRHDAPRVYIAEALPLMDELGDVPHRALDEFEADALPSLRYQQDVVVDQRPERIAMLGAIRAGSDCLQCHEGARGDLLGAFSYELVRQKGGPFPRDEKAVGPLALWIEEK
jgi:hypothetical protein